MLSPRNPAKEMCVVRLIIEAYARRQNHSEVLMWTFFIVISLGEFNWKSSLETETEISWRDIIWINQCLEHMCTLSSPSDTKQER